MCGSSKIFQFQKKRNHQNEKQAHAAMSSLSVCHSLLRQYEYTTNQYTQYTQVAGFTGTCNRNKRQYVKAPHEKA